MGRKIFPFSYHRQHYFKCTVIVSAYSCSLSKRLFAEIVFSQRQKKTSYEMQRNPRQSLALSCYDLNLFWMLETMFKSHITFALYYMLLLYVNHMYIFFISSLMVPWKCATQLLDLGEKLFTEVTTVIPPQKNLCSADNTKHSSHEWRLRSSA